MRRCQTKHIPAKKLFVRQKNIKDRKYPHISWTLNEKEKKYIAVIETRKINAT